MRTAKFLEYAQQYTPGLNIKLKDESVFMKLLGVLTKPFCPTFMTHYITTIGMTVYYPREYLANHDTHWVLAHEFVHACQSKKNPLYPVLYLMPAPLILLALPALLAIWFSNWWLLSLVVLVFGLPLPAYFRMKYEVEGYAMSAVLPVWHSVGIVPIDSLAQSFTSSNYYFMWPFKQDITKRLKTAIDAAVLAPAGTPYGYVKEMLAKEGECDL